eukprot:GGOE01009257.1.p1 GENE.GGOE01009257.1~~GGOE01009257.1.p1  ORF type:complete len:1004 (-),score=204.79 GGOE01009257.1:535-3270(-)
MTPLTSLTLTPLRVPDLDSDDDALSCSPTSLEDTVVLGGGRLMVTVAVRVRPFTKRESTSGQAPSLAAEGNQLAVIANPPLPAPPAVGQQFDFDHVFWPAEVPCVPARPVATQQTVFEALASPLLTELARGFNGALLCYGQTGTGKTYTMNGTAAHPGIIPRRPHLIDKEVVYDLLATDAGSPRRRVSCNPAARRDTPWMRRLSSPSNNAGVPCSQPPGLRVRHDPVRGTYVEGLSQRIVHSAADLLGLWKQGEHLRASATTHLNDRSSRSHMLMVIEVSQQALISELGEKDAFSSKVSRLHLGDLAGSEHVAMDCLKDPVRSSSNLSLSTLGHVIELLSDPGAHGTSPLPPYRDSTLTSLLANAFGGNCKTSFIATVSPALGHLPETLATLRLASRVRRIVNRPVINEDPNTALISALQQETQVLRQRLQLITASPSTQAEVPDSGRLRCKLDFSERLALELGDRRGSRAGDSGASPEALRVSHKGFQRQLTDAQEEIRRMTAEAATHQRVLTSRDAGMADMAAEQGRLRSLLEAKEREVEVLRRDMLSVSGLTTVESEDDCASTSWAWSPLSPGLPAMVDAATQTDVPASTSDFSPRCAACFGRPRAGESASSTTGDRNQAVVASLARQLAATLSKLQEAEGRWARERAELLERLERPTLPGDECTPRRSSGGEGTTPSEGAVVMANACPQHQVALQQEAERHNAPTQQQEVATPTPCPDTPMTDGAPVAVGGGGGMGSMATATSKTEENDDLMDTRLLQAVVAEYSNLLQFAVQDRPEWKEFFRNLQRTIEAVSGKPPTSFWLSWFTPGPSTTEELVSALQRQEALNARVVARLAALKVQREMLQHTIKAQIRVNTCIAKERTGYANEVVDLRGRLERACAVLKRLHWERDMQTGAPSSRICTACSGE